VKKKREPDDLSGAASLLYEAAASYDQWLKLTLGGVVALTLVLGITLITIDATSAAVLFAATLFDALLFFFIMPRRYQVLSDRIRIILGDPLSLDIPFSNIKEALPSSGSNAFFSTGIRFATSNRDAVQIIRNEGLDFIISPSGNISFMVQLNIALRDYRENH